jgi:hypothetical protein
MEDVFGETFADRRKPPANMFRRPPKKIPTRLPLGRATCLGTLLGSRLIADRPAKWQNVHERQTRRGKHSRILRLTLLMKELRNLAPPTSE